MPPATSHFSLGPTVEIDILPSFGINPAVNAATGPFTVSRTSNWIIGQASEPIIAQTGGAGSPPTTPQGLIGLESFQLQPGKTPIEASGDAMALSESGFQIAFGLESEAELVIEASSDLSSWQELGNATPEVDTATLSLTQAEDASASTTFVDEEAPSMGHRFYRARSTTDPRVSTDATGFVRLTLPPGFSLISNPFEGNNSIGNLFSDVPEGTMVYLFDSETGTFSVNTYQFGAWLMPDQELAPGQGAFVNNPKSSEIEVVLTGKLPSESREVSFKPGFNLVSSPFPFSGELGEGIPLSLMEGNVVYTLDPSSNQYEAFRYPLAWENGDAPELKPGQAFWVHKAEPGTWIQSFSSTR